MALKKVAPSSQWQSGGKGANPAAYYLIESGSPAEYTLTTDRSAATHVAKFNSTDGDYDVVTIATAGADRIVGIAPANEYRII